MSDRPIIFSAPMVRAILAGQKTQTRRLVKPQPTHFSPAGVPRLAHPERLYVRETWAAPHAYDHLPPRLIPQDARIHYAATEDRGGLLWRPSIHMPRWASRITLEVTGVRVELLQDIDLADALAEGISDTGALILDSAGNEQGGPIAEYAVLWEQINGPGSWDANPWVWVLDFKGLP